MGILEEEDRLIAHVPEMQFLHGCEEEALRLLADKLDGYREALRKIVEDTDFGDSMDAIAREALGLPKSRC